MNRGNAYRGNGATHLVRTWIRIQPVTTEEPLLPTRVAVVAWDVPYRRRIRQILVRVFQHPPPTPGGGISPRVTQPRSRLGKLGQMVSRGRSGTGLARVVSFRVPGGATRGEHPDPQDFPMGEVFWGMGERVSAFGIAKCAFSEVCLQPSSTLFP